MYFKHDMLSLRKIGKKHTFPMVKKPNKKLLFKNCTCLKYR